MGSAGCDGSVTASAANFPQATNPELLKCTHSSTQHDHAEEEEEEEEEDEEDHAEAEEEAEWDENGNSTSRDMGVLCM